MKMFLVAILMAAFSCFADNPLENFSPHFSTNTEIIWNTSTNSLPKSFWIYQRLPSRPFSATVISNAVVLASLQSKGFPKISTNDFFLAEDKGPNYPGPIPVYFGIYPKSATISYSMPHSGTNIADITADKILMQRAWDCAAQFGINSAQATFKNMTSHFNHDENDNDLTNQLSGRGVFLSRKLDGILFWGTGEDANDGFWIEFGSHGQIRAFSYVWPDLKRDELQSTASPQQIITCIRAHRIIVVPNVGEETYFQRVKSLANAKTFTITKITPYYMEGILGETPTNDAPPEIISPVVELDAAADFGNSNAAVRFLAPIVLAK